MDALCNMVSTAGRRSALTEPHSRAAQIIRPPRAAYDPKRALPGPSIRIGTRLYTRTDLQVRSGTHLPGGETAWRQARAAAD